MQKPLQIWHLVVVTVMFFITAVTLVANQSSRITKDEMEILHLQEDKVNTQAQFREFNNNLKDVNTSLIQIRILLEDKQDRQR